MKSRAKSSRQRERSKKEELIKEFNPEWDFLNADIMEWPPDDHAVSR